MRVAETEELVKRKKYFRDTNDIFFSRTWICAETLEKLWDIPNGVQYIQLVGYDHPIKDSYEVRQPKQTTKTRYSPYVRDITVVYTNSKKVSYMLSGSLRKKLAWALNRSNTNKLYVKLYYWF